MRFKVANKNMVQLFSHILKSYVLGYESAGPPAGDTGVRHLQETIKQQPLPTGTVNAEALQHHHGSLSCLHLDCQHCHSQLIYN